MYCMSLSERGVTQEERSEFTEQLADQGEAVSLDQLVDETSVESRREAKRVLRVMIDEGQVSTTPGFKYQLTSRSSSTDSV